jgi:hypothetical protein
MQFFTVVGAYGRDYKSGKAMKEDWAKGLDFRIVSGPSDNGRYCSSRDFGKGIVVHGRFKNLAGITTLHDGKHDAPVVDTVSTPQASTSLTPPMFTVGALLADMSNRRHERPDLAGNWFDHVEQGGA